MNVFAVARPLMDASVRFRLFFDFKNQLFMTADELNRMIEEELGFKHHLELQVFPETRVRIGGRLMDHAQPVQFGVSLKPHEIALFTEVVGSQGKSWPEIRKIMRATLGKEYEMIFSVHLRDFGVFFSTEEEASLLIGISRPKPVSTALTRASSYAAA